MFNKEVTSSIRRGDCIEYRKAYKRPVLFFKKERLFKLLLDDSYYVTLDFSSFDVIFDKVREWVSKSDGFKILSPDVSLGADGDIIEIAPARKIRLLPVPKTLHGLVFLDESPKDISCGLGVTKNLDIKEYSNEWWQRYYELHKRFKKLRREKSVLVSKINSHFRKYIDL